MWTRSCLYQLHQIWDIRHNLSFSTHSSWCAWTNVILSLLVCQTSGYARSSPSITATRFITNRSKYSHISKYMQDTLHWLPVTQCIAFKTILLTHASNAGTASSGSSEFQSWVSWLDARCALWPMEICTLQLEPILPSCALDHPPGTVSHHSYVLLSFTLCHF